MWSTHSSCGYWLPGLDRYQVQGVSGIIDLAFVWCGGNKGSGLSSFVMLNRKTSWMFFLIVDEMCRLKCLQLCYILIGLNFCFAVENVKDSSNSITHQSVPNVFSHFIFFWQIAERCASYSEGGLCCLWTDWSPKLWHFGEQNILDCPWLSNSKMWTELYCNVLKM